MISRRALLAALPLAAACDSKPGSGFRGQVFVASEDDAALAVVDLMAFAVRSRITLSAPAGILAAHPDPKAGRFFALARNGRSADEIDARTQKRLRTFQMTGPAVAAKRQGGVLWVLSGGAQPALTPVDGKPIVLAGEPVGFDVSSKAPLAAVTMADGTVLFVELDKGRVRAKTELGPGLGAVMFRSDGKLVLVAERSRRLLTALDPAGQIVTQLALAISPDRLCVNADGGQFFMTGVGRDAVVIAYPYRTEIAQTALSGRKPGAMGVSAQPELLFVANPEAGSVTVFDITTQKVLAVVGVGVEPSAILVTPDQQYALVLNHSSGDMAVIRIASIRGTNAKSAPLFTMIPVGAKPGAALITAQR